MIGDSNAANPGRCITSEKLIIEKSIEIFCKKGYSATNMEDIAKAANLSRSPLYYHFKNKQVLFTTAFSKCCDDVEQITKDIFMQDINVFDKFEMELAALMENGLYAVERMRNDVRTQPVDLAEAYTRYINHRKYLRIIKVDSVENAIECGALRKNCSAKDFVDMGFIFYRGLMAESVLWANPKNRDRISALLALFINMLRTQYQA